MEHAGMLTWVTEDLVDQQGRQNSDPPSYRPRATHTKSRNGCHNCKLRRIKCNESRPSCGQCVDRGVRCDFVKASTSSQATLSISFGQTDKNAQPRSSAREWIESYLDHALIPCPQLKSLTHNPCDSLELLNHFFEATGSWIGSPECQKTMQQHCLHLSVEAPYVLHALLAFSANHLSFLHQTERRYSITATFHYDSSLASYSSQIHTRLDATHADSLLACCHLHTMLAFRNLQSIDSVDEENPLIWLRTMQGAGILRNNLHPYLNESVWRSVAIESRSWEQAICNHLDSDDSWASSISRALHQLCEADPGSMSKKNPYEEPLSRLCLLMQCQIGQDKIGMFMSFIGRLSPSFVQLLDRNDPKATLMLCYWCALLSQIDQWWIVDSAAVECLRLCKFLDAIPDQRIRNLLSFPAGKCGYVAR